VQGVMLATRLRQLYPQISITEAHQHHGGKDRRHACERISAKFRDEIILDKAGRSLRYHDQQVWQRKCKQRRSNWALQEKLRSGMELGTRRPIDCRVGQFALGW
jgi:hypothetical protein